MIRAQVCCPGSEGVRPLLEAAVTGIAKAKLEARRDKAELLARIDALRRKLPAPPPSR